MDKPKYRVVGKRFRVVAEGKYKLVEKPTRHWKVVGTEYAVLDTGTNRNVSKHGKKSAAQAEAERRNRAHAFATKGVNVNRRPKKKPKYEVIAGRLVKVSG